MSVRFVSRSLVVVLAVLAWTLCGPTATAQTADEIVELNIKAIGGPEAIKALKNVSRKGALTLAGIMGNAEGTTEQVIVYGKKAYLSWESDMLIQKWGYNGAEAWLDDMAQALRKIEGTDAEYIIGQTAAPGTMQDESLKRLDDETVGEAEHYVLQGVNDAGETGGKVYIDKKTCLLTQLVVTQDSPEFGGEVTIVLGYSDYEEHAGVKLAKTETVEVGEGMIEVTMTYSSTKVNGDIDDSIFEMPGSDTP